LQLQSNEGHVAKDAVLEAVACGEEMIPALLNVLRDVANNSEPYASAQSTFWRGFVRAGRIPT
jgi:hypothetical protein